VVRDPHLLFVGALAPQDGVADLPALVSSLRDRGLDPRLTVVGDGQSRPTLERAFAEGGLQRYVTFTGWVPHERVPDLLAEADICIDPAGCSPLNHRSTMIKICEYMAAARPIVAYRLVETERTASDAALFAPCGDRQRFAALVAELAADGGLRERLGARAHERAAGLVWERSQEALLDAYRRL
jgi:glycosyltransferase involved in cell wall biosynthesis